MGNCDATWPAGDDTKVYEAWSNNGTLNVGAETNEQCAKRRMREAIESAILTYFKAKDGKAAEDGATGVTIS